MLVQVLHTAPQDFGDVRIKSSVEADYIVGRSMTELTKLVSGVASSIEHHVDEVWVPGEAIKKIFVANGVPQEKLVVVPEPLDTHFFDPAAHDPLPLPLNESRPEWWQWCNKPVPDADKRYKFFSNFKWEPRKGWDVLFEAYDRAFSHGQSNDVSLYVLTYFYANDVNIYDDIKRKMKKEQQRYQTSPPATTLTDEIGGAVAKSSVVTSSAAPATLTEVPAITLPIENGPILATHHVQLVINAIEEYLQSDLSKKYMRNVTLSDLPHFCIITEMVSEEDLVRLYRTMDAFVLPTRGEGWGLPTIQAMSMGMPTISTNWGGNTEFMTKDTSFLIPVDGLDELPKGNLYGSEGGKKWALPSVAETSSLMRHVWLHATHATEVGLRARRHIVERFSEAAILDIVDQRLEDIRKIIRAK